MLGSEGHARGRAILIFSILRTEIAAEKENKHVLTNPCAVHSQLKKRFELWSSFVEGGKPHYSCAKLMTIHDFIEYENTCKESPQNSELLEDY